MKSPRTRKFVLVGAIVLVALSILREVGVVDLDLSSAQLDAEHWSRRDVARSGRPNGSSTVVRFDAEWKESDWLAPQTPGPNTPTQVVVCIAPYEVEGLTWTPLYKTGSCSYTAKVVRDGLEWGTAEGRIELVVKGMASMRSVRERLRKEIREQASKTVESWLRS